MVGFDSTQLIQLNSQERLVAGCLSGLFSRFVVQPLDVLKIRFQLQVEPISATCPSSKYYSLWQATNRIYQEEGSRALWKGHTAAQIQAVLFSLVQFQTFEYFTYRSSQLRQQMESQKQSTVFLQRIDHFVCGGLAGCCASIVSQPFDVLRTRFIAQGEPRVYTGLLHATSCMLAQEGPKAYFRGLSPTLALIVPQTAIQFGFYRLYTRLYSYIFHQHQPQDATVLQSAFAGSAAGITAKLVIYPLDIAKKRLQVQGFELARSRFGKLHKSRHLWQTFQVLVQEEGLLALYKGLKPALVKASVSIGVRFMTYEQCCTIMRNLKRPKGRLS